MPLRVVQKLLLLVVVKSSYTPYFIVFPQTSLPEESPKVR